MSLYQIGRHGELRLSFERRQGKTVLAEHYSRPPLQVMRAIPDSADCLCVYLLSPTGGVVQHDRYDIDITLAEKTHGLFTTQSATKIYRMPEGCAEQNVRVDVGPGAMFEYLPDAAILFADADYRQRTDFFLHPGALVLAVDVVMPGRLAMGERLQFRQFANRLTARDEDGLLLYESSVLHPGQSDLEVLGRLEGYACWGTAYLMGDLAGWGLDAAVLCQQIAEKRAEYPLPLTDGLEGMTTLHKGGMCLRVLSHRLETIYEAFQQLRGLVRQSLGMPTAPLRK